MENKNLNKNNADEQETPAPYFTNEKSDAKTKNVSAKTKSQNLKMSKQDKNKNTPTQYSKNKDKINKQNTPIPIIGGKFNNDMGEKINKVNNDTNKTEQPNSANNFGSQSAENKRDKKEKRKPKTKKPKAWVWIVKVFIMAVGLSLAFSLLSEFTLSKTNIAVSIVVILVFIAVSIVFDMLGLAVASCPIEPFTAMAARKVAGSKLAISLIKNADKVSAICCDVIGDVCGILAGAGGASILTKIALSSSGFMPIFVASLISAIIAGLTIGGKASFKRLARAKSSPITLKFAQVLNLFVHKK